MPRAEYGPHGRAEAWDMDARAAASLVAQVVEEVKAETDESLDAESPYFWAGVDVAVDALRTVLGLESTVIASE